MIAWLAAGVAAGLALAWWCLRAGARSDTVPDRLEVGTGALDVTARPVSDDE